MAAQFNPVTPELLAELRQVVGDKYVKTDEDYLERYQTDEEGNSHYFHKPEVVVFPGSTEEVAAIVKLANKYLVPITPRSAGSGVACGAIPVYHGMVVELERMNQILKFDADNMYAVCQTGVITGDLQREAAKHGLLYAGDPSSADSSMIGGNVANNAGGNKAVKYGTTRHQIYSLKVVTPTGDILDAGARLKKSSTGLSWNSSLPVPKARWASLRKSRSNSVPCRRMPSIWSAFSRPMKKPFALPNKILKAGIDPTSIEFMDNEALRMTCKFLDMKMPHVDEGCDYVIVTVESFSEDDSDRKMEQLCDLAEANGSIDEFEADKRIWTLRKQFAEAARDVDKMFQTEDFVVPLDKIPEITKQIPELREKYDLYCVTVAHIGDGNIHVLPLNAKGLSPEEWFQKIKAFHRDLFPRVYALGGKMSGEHGIGYKKLEEFALCTPQAELNVIKAIKKALDPNNIMNPGKLVEIG